MKILLFAVLMAGVSFGAHAQVSRDSELFTTLKALDDALFERSFNQCESAVLENIVSDDFEFYHDSGGFENSKASFIETVEKNICSNPAQKPIRKLVEGSLEVFPLYGNGVLYGAIQRGEHEFYIREADKPLRHTSSARFTHVWIKEGDSWMLKRVLSYDHYSPDQGDH
ncbi:MULTISPECIES: nuclear transport factor 2 family protein [Kordiimonas]|jgi:hypothetical protein|uniref:DUF4440 domain-containing protein n=1 Tax=Kordiimonas lacus TaxID=637679 RepID=A0A1G6T6H4_9PROT|nr:MULTISPECIES: nuclear transport factor 2 family protein [Kordiimonas]SDD24067.1 protein of unknown function [Kordiimonas lacus]